MIADRNRIFDGWITLEAGVDAGRAPFQIDINQAVSAENMTFRGGIPSTRPGFRLMIESFTNPNQCCYGQPYDETVSATSGKLVVGTIYTIATYVSGDNFTNVGGVNHTGDIFTATGTTPANWAHGSTLTHVVHHLVGEYAGDQLAPRPPQFENQDAVSIYRNGIFQSATCYSPHNLSEDCIMALIGGRLFKIVPGVTSSKVTEIAPITDVSTPYLRNRSDSTIAYMVQADKWLIAQDGDSKAIIYDAVKARRSVTETTSDKTEIPKGTIMAYGMGRLEVVVNQRSIAFGDLYGSHALPDPADSIIFFTERNFISEGFDADIPFQQGQVTGLAFFPQLDTSTGNGELLAFAQRGAASFFLSLDRTLWKTSQFQIFALLTTGLRGHRSISVVNEDLWFRADDGVRSYRQARSEPSGWAHIPLSTNVQQFLGNDTPSMLQYASSIYFDNRVLLTTSPMWNQGRPVHTGLVVVDFDILSAFGVQNKPAWEGHWTLPQEITISQVVSGSFNGVQRAFAFAVFQGQNFLLELSLDDVTDWGDQSIEWELVSRAFDFQKLSQQSSPFAEVELYDGDVWLQDVEV